MLLMFLFAVKVVENNYAYFADRLYHTMKVIALVTGRWILQLKMLFCINVFCKLQPNVSCTFEILDKSDVYCTTVVSYLQRNVVAYHLHMD